jgi:hypothetical protein
MGFEVRGGHQTPVTSRGYSTSNRHAAWRDGRYCPNRHCPHAEATGEPAQYQPGITTCGDCGSSLVETEPVWVEEDTVE